MFRQNPPGALPSLPAAQQFEPRDEYGKLPTTVYVTSYAITPQKPGIENYLLLNITNKMAAQAISFPDGARPKIVVSFVTGNTRNALCTDEQLKVLDVKVFQTEPDVQWDIEKDDTAEIPVWVLRPRASNANLLNQGGQAVFRISNLVTQLQPDAATAMFIQYAAVPGYADGFEVLSIWKTTPQPYVRSFNAFAGDRLLEFDAPVNYKDSLTLRWDVFGADGCHITGLPNRFGPTDSCTVYPTTAIAKYSLQPIVGDRQYPGVDVEVSVRPPAASLAAQPTAVAPNAKVTLNWVCTSGDCRLTGGGLVVNGLPLVGSYDVYPGATTDYTIQCIGLSTVSSTTTVQVPPPVVSIGARSERIVGEIITGVITTVAWQTQYANTCRVSIDGPDTELSTALSGTHTFFDGPSGAPRRTFRIVAVGNGTVVKVT